MPPFQDKDVGFSAKFFFSSTSVSTMMGTWSAWSSTRTIQRRTRRRTRMQTRTMMRATTAATIKRTPSACLEATWSTVSCSSTIRSSASSSLASRLTLRRAGECSEYLVLLLFFIQMPFCVFLPICSNIQLQLIWPQVGGPRAQQWKPLKKLFFFTWFSSCLGNKMN